MHEGQIVQTGTPVELFEKPKHTFVGHIKGTPGMNILPCQIKKGDMATVIGIFEHHYNLNKPLPVVRPGNQTRRFTHIEDTIDTCFEAWKRNKNSHYSISNKKSFTILEVAKLFSKKIDIF